jgi:GNAT superfamily N-acetyltransferase
MYIRRPTLHDLNECVRLDPSYTTQRVWQMQLNIEATAIHAHFQLAPLPRPLTLPGPAFADNLLACWQRGDCMYIARLDNGIAGFIHMAPDPTTRIGRIEHHVVAPAHRRRGIGTALLRRVWQWAQEHNLHSLSVAINHKNHPALSFYTATALSSVVFRSIFSVIAKLFSILPVGLVIGNW